MAVFRRTYRFLIVDDDETDREVYARLLTRHVPGVCNILQTANGTAGLAALCTQRFDCVLLDFNLPDMSGLKFLADAAVAGELPCGVVLITGQGNESIAVEAMKCGVQDYLVKNQVNGGSLWLAIARAMAQIELRQKLAFAQRDLEHHEALLSSILDTMPDALVVFDEQELIQSFSIAACRMFGFSSEEVIGRNIRTLVSYLHEKEHFGYLTRHLSIEEHRAAGAGNLVVGRRKDGSTFPIEFTIGQVNLPEARLFTGFARDLTDRQDRERRFNELQAELIHVSRLNELGQMVAAFAHEVNQPLTAIVNYLSGARRLLAAGKHDDAQQAIVRVADQTDRARQIIQRLRDHVKKREPERRVENLLKTIEEANILARGGVRHDEKQYIRVDPEAMEAVIDKVQIQQVLINLIHNAEEAMAGSVQNRLSITTARAGDMVEISVSDTGPGLPEAVRAKLFQAFVTTKLTGMGVGLSVCRTIVEAHGGELSAVDRADGGTIFRFTVPRHEGVLLHQACQRTNGSRYIDICRSVPIRAER